MGTSSSTPRRRPSYEAERGKKERILSDRMFNRMLTEAGSKTLNDGDAPPCRRGRDCAMEDSKVETDHARGPKMERNAK